jgi:hypothetical protein
MKYRGFNFVAANIRVKVSNPSSTHTPGLYVHTVCLPHFCLVCLVLVESFKLRMEIMKKHVRSGCS